jgi:hypothetical protein
MQLIASVLASQTLDQSAIENVYGNSDLLYGETPPTSIRNILDTAGVKNTKSKVFVDVGCGRGHAVFGAATSFKFAKCVGIELVQAHVDAANSVMETLHEMKAHLLSPDMQFVCADVITSTEAHRILQEADVVYCYDLAFSKSLRHKVAAVFAAHLPAGARVITTHTDPLPSAAFCPVTPLFSWQAEFGQAPVRAYEKKAGGYEAWLAEHRSQLKDLPETLWERAHTKMLESNFDIGEYVQLGQVNDAGLDLVAVATLAT